MLQFQLHYNSSATARDCVIDWGTLMPNIKTQELATSATDTNLRWFTVFDSYTKVVNRLEIFGVAYMTFPYLKW